MIGDDRSTDKTRAILQEYESQYNNIIVIYHETRQGVGRNRIHTFRRCRGKYIAEMDGDDRMLPGKLQKQIDFMENHPDFVMCGHDMRIFEHGSEKTLGYYNQHVKLAVGTIEDLLRYLVYIGPNSLIFREKDFDIDLYERLWGSMQYNGDEWLRHFIIARHGKIGYLDEVLGEYRRHAGAITQYHHNKERRLQALQEILFIADRARIFGVKNDLINYAKAKLCGFAAEDLLLWREKKDFKDLMEKSWELYPDVSRRYQLFYRLRHVPEVLLLVKRWEHFFNTKFSEFYISLLKMLKLYSGNT